MVQLLHQRVVLWHHQSQPRCGSCELERCIVRARTCLCEPGVRATAHRKRDWECHHARVWIKLHRAHFRVRELGGNQFLRIFGLKNESLSHVYRRVVAECDPWSWSKIPRNTQYFCAKQMQQYQKSLHQLNLARPMANTQANPVLTQCKACDFLGMWGHCGDDVAVAKSSACLATGLARKPAPSMGIKLVPGGLVF